MIWHRLHTPLIGALWYFRRKLLTLLRNGLPLAAAAGGPSPQADTAAPPLPVLRQCRNITRRRGDRGQGGVEAPGAPTEWTIARLRNAPAAVFGSTLRIIALPDQSSATFNPIEACRNFRSQSESAVTWL